MGIKIEFGSLKHKSIRHLFADHFTHYRESVIESEKEFPGERSVELKLLNSINNSGDLINLDARSADDIISDFIGIYCDSTMHGQGLITDVGSGYLIFRYENDQYLINRCSPEVQKLWQYLLKGRSILQPDDFFNPSIEDDFKVGWWSKVEQNLMLDDLKNKVVTDKDFKADVHLGISSVYDVLIELSEYNNDLIITAG